MCASISLNFLIAGSKNRTNSISQFRLFFPTRIFIAGMYALMTIEVTSYRHRQATNNNSHLKQTPALTVAKHRPSMLPPSMSALRAEPPVVLLLPRCNLLEPLPTVAATHRWVPTVTPAAAAAITLTGAAAAAAAVERKVGMEEEEAHRRRRQHLRRLRLRRQLGCYWTTISWNLPRGVLYRCTIAPRSTSTARYVYATVVHVVLGVFGLLLLILIIGTE